MSKKISQLTALITTTDTDVLPIVSAGETKKITYGNLKSAILTDVRWSDVTRKPFTSIGSGLTVTNDVLSAVPMNISWNEVTSKPFISIGNGLTVTGGVLSANGYTLPQANETILGGIKAKAKTTESVEVAIDTTTGKLYIPATSGVDFTDIQDMLVGGDLMNIVADTTNETLTFNVNGKTITTYANDTVYAIGDIVVYSSDLYQRLTAGTDTEWTSVNWACLTSGTDGQNAYVHIKYSTAQPTQDSDMSDTPNNYMGIYSGISSTAPTTYTSYNWFNIKGATGNTGSNGADGTTPTIDSTTKHWLIGLVDSEVCAEGKDGTKFYTGTDYPTSNLKDGDLFLSFATATLGNVYKYVLSTTSWSLQGNLKGASGGANIDDVAISTQSCFSNSHTTQLLALKSNIPTVSSLLTLLPANWVENHQTVSCTVDITKRNVIDITANEMNLWAEAGVYATEETATGINFTCSTVPTQNLTFKITSMQISESTG